MMKSRGLDGREPAATGVGRVRWIAIVTAFVNLGIHVYLSPMHLQEKFYIGVLFLIGSAALAVVVVGLATDRDRPRTLAWLLGFATSVVMLIAFVLSRTIGLPGGYLETWAKRPEDILGLVSLGLELIFCLCCLASVTTSGQLKTATTSTADQRVLLSLHDRTAPFA